MTAKRPYLEALDIPLWLPRRPLAGTRVDSCPPESSNHPGAARHPSLSKEGKKLYHLRRAANLRP